MTKRDLIKALTDAGIELPKKANRDALFALALQHGLVSEVLPADEGDENTDVNDLPENPEPLTKTLHDPENQDPNGLPEGENDVVTNVVEGDTNTVEKAPTTDLPTGEKAEELNGDSQTLNPHIGTDAWIAELDRRVDAWKAENEGLADDEDTLAAVRSDAELKMISENWEPVKVKRTVVPEQYKKAYGKAGNCGDEMASRLGELCKTKDGLDLQKLIDIGWENEIDVEGKWGERNPGMKRMNLSNVLRNRLKQGQKVTLGGQVFGGDEEDMDLNEAEG